MNQIAHIKLLLRESVERTPVAKGVYYKTGPGDYAAHDRFIGVNVPSLRIIAKQFHDLSLVDLQSLMASKINEERLLALLILVSQYQTGNIAIKNTHYDFYVKNFKHINNWNLVDASAHYIIGAHLFETKMDKKILLSWAASNILWERRIAIVSTWYFIRKQDLKWTIKIAKTLLNDEHDLIHKAVGWMLREMGKQDVNVLKQFLNQYALKMPRTMLRYAIEKFPEKERKQYLYLK